MAVLTVTIQLPVRAALWVHKLSNDQKVSVRKFLEGVVLRSLLNTPGVDLGQSPGDILQKGVQDGEEADRSSHG
jgi:hypothetical protein